MTNNTTFAQEAFIAWKWASVIFGNILAAVMLIAWWQGETWVRANANAMLELSNRPGWQVKK